MTEINEIKTLIDAAQKSRDELLMSIEEGQRRIEQLEQQQVHEEYWSDPDMIRDDEIEDLISALNKTNFAMAECMRIKEALEPRLAELLKHGEDGSKTYTVGKYKVTCKTGWVYTLNKEEYVTMGSHLPACFNPVKIKMSYELNKKVIRDAEKYASAEELRLLESMITKKESKLNIKILAGN